MQINKTDRCMHIVSFNTKEHIANGYVFICTSDDDDDYRSVNKALLNNSFIHSEFQAEFNKLGVTKANIEELVAHRFITSNNLTGFGLGHQYINNCITSNKGLLHIVNLGDWLSNPGVVSVDGVEYKTPRDNKSAKDLYEAIANASGDIKFYSTTLGYSRTSSANGVAVHFKNVPFESSNCYIKP